MDMLPSAIRKLVRVSIVEILLMAATVIVASLGIMATPALELTALVSLALAPVVRDLESNMPIPVISSLLTTSNPTILFAIASK